MSLSSHIPPRLKYFGLGYFALINLSTFGLFAYDKLQATQKGWRVRENDLHLTALLGGWIGGMTAMQVIRHKSKKKTFQVPYVLCSMANAAAITGLGIAYRFSPNIRKKILRFCKQVNKKI